MNMSVSGKTISRKTLLIANIRLLTLMAVLTLVSACASKQTDDEYDETNSHKAAESNTSLGLEYMNRGQYEVALGKLKKAIKEEPGYAPAHTVLAVLYERIGEKNLAGKHYQLAFEADPKNGDVNNNYGVYLCQTGKADQAMGHFMKSLEDPFYSSPAVALTNAGSCALGNDDFSSANDYLRAALKIEPEFPDTLLAMSRLNFRQQDMLKSRAFMQRYEAVAKHNPASLLLAYQIATASNNSKGASRYMLILETSYPESDQAAEARRLSGR